MDPHARSYSMESKLFYLGLFERSPDAYRWLQRVYPIPSESNLNNTFSLTIKSREFDMLSLDSLSKTIQRVNFTEKVDSVLSVDAFSATYLMKITDQKLTSNDEIEYKMILNASKVNFEKLFNKPSDYDKQFENVNINIQDSMKGEILIIMNLIIIIIITTLIIIILILFKI